MRPMSLFEAGRSAGLAALLATRDYLDEIARVDVGRVDATHRDPNRVGRLLQSLARNVATHAAATTLARDTGGTDRPLKDDTVREYLHALERLMVVEDQPAWAAHLRSKHRLRAAPKRHFVDPSLAVAALRTTPDRLLGDLKARPRADRRRSGKPHAVRRADRHCEVRDPGAVGRHRRDRLRLPPEGRRGGHSDRSARTLTCSPRSLELAVT
jgi:hypothetical protein